MLACTEPPARTENERVQFERPELERTQESTSDSDGCELHSVERWLDRGGGSPALAMDREGGLALVLDDGVLHSRALSSEGRPIDQARTSALLGGRALLALVPRSDRYLVLAYGSCEASAYCLLAQALDRHGAALAGPTSVVLPDPIRTSRRAGDGSLFFAWSTTSGYRGLERFALRPDGSVAHERIALGEQPASSEKPVEILGLAVDAERFAVVWRQGVTEDTRSEVYLTSGEASVKAAEHEVHALHDVLAVDSIALEEGVLTLITTFEFSRPHLLSIDVSTGEPTMARELARSERAPSPFVGRERAELDVDRAGLWLRRRDAAGDPLGERVRLIGARIEGAALTRSGDSLFAIWIAEGATHGRRVTCR